MRALISSIAYCLALVALAIGALFAYDRFIAAAPPPEGESIYAMDVLPYTGFHIQSHAASGNLKTGDNGFFIDFPLSKPPKKEPDEYRIILIGGSSAMGVYLPSNDKTMAAQLELLLNDRPPIPKRFRVINLAMAAAQTYQNFIALNRWGHAMEPDLILSFSGRNDIHGPYLTRSDLPYRYPEVMGLMAATRSWEGPPWLQKMMAWFPRTFGNTSLGFGIRASNRNNLGERERLAYKKHNATDGPIYENVIEPLYLHALRSIKRDFDGIPVMVAFQPARYIPYYDFMWNEWMEMFGKMRTNTPRELSHYVNDRWSFVDVHQHFLDRGLMVPELLPDDCHLSEKGHRAVAELLHSRLVSMLQEPQ